MYIYFLFKQTAYDFFIFLCFIKIVHKYISFQRYTLNI